MNAFNGHATHGELPAPYIEGMDNLNELYYFAWDLARQHITHRPGLAAEDFMDEGFDPEQIWQWDTCFMALYCRYAHDLFPGIESLDNFYKSQRNDGYISMSHKLATGEDSYPLPDIGGRINPPLLSWAEYEYYLITGNNARIHRILAHLIALDDWIEANRKRADGSYWFEDCGSSGMDNSPRTTRADHHGAETGFVDLAAQQALSALCLSRLAMASGDDATAEKYRTLHSTRVHFLNAFHWNERHAFYYDRHTDGNFVNSKTAASFWPLIAEACTEKQAHALAKHLTNPQEFNRPHPIPTLSYDECNYHEDGHYWLGGVWAPTNFMIVKGLLKYGYHKLAADIALKHLLALDRIRCNHTPHTLWECYSPEQDLPAVNGHGKPCREDFVGWTGLGPIGMLIECLLGIELDYPNGSVTCHPTLLQAHGVKNLRFGPHRISIQIAARSHASTPPKIDISAPDEVQLKIIHSPSAKDSLHL